jgi:hypothetical protein
VISVLPLFVLDTNATTTLDRNESPTRTILYINGRDMRAPSNAGTETKRDPVAGKRAPA